MFWRFRKLPPWIGRSQKDVYKRQVPSSATMAIRSAVQLNSRPLANVGTSEAATQIAAKIR